MLNLTHQERDEVELRYLAMRLLAMCEMYSEFAVREAAQYVRQECGDAGARLANLMVDLAEGKVELP